MSTGDAGDRGKERERGARPKVRQSRSEERHKGGRGKRKGCLVHEAASDRPVSDGFEYGDFLNGLEPRNGGSLFRERRWRQVLSSPVSSLTEKVSARISQNTPNDEQLAPETSSKSSSGSRTLRQKIQDAVGQCFPIKTHSGPSSSGQGISTSPVTASSRRKIHLSELMLDSCPFPPGSELAQKWYLIKQHTAPISQAPVLDTFSGTGAWASACSASSASGVEDEDSRLLERRRIGIEQGVDPPPNGQSHTFEVTAQINPLYKLAPKLAHGTNELAGDDRGTLQQQQQHMLQRQQQQHQLLLQSCLDTLDEVVASSSGSAPSFSTESHQDSDSSSCSPCSLTRGSLMTTEHFKPQDGHHRAHTQIDYIHCLVPDLLQITNLPCYWGVMDRYEAETLLEGKPEGTFLLRDSAQEDYLFSVSFRRYGRSLHARIEQWNHNFSFDVHDPSVFHAPTVTGLLEHYKDPSLCMFFEPLLSNPIHRTRPFSLQHICRAVISSCTTYDGISALPVPNALKEHLKEYHYKRRVRVRRLDTGCE